MAIVDEQLFSDHAINATAFRLAPMRTERPTMGRKADISELALLALTTGLVDAEERSSPRESRVVGRCDFAPIGAASGLGLVEAAAHWVPASTETDNDDRYNRHRNDA